MELNILTVELNEEIAVPPIGPSVELSTIVLLTSSTILPEASVSENASPVLDIFCNC